MSILVRDILNLELLKDAKLITGKGGLNREVLRVNFTDCPLSAGDPGYSLVQKGDLYILSLYIQSQNEVELYNLINFYIQTGSACCIAINTYVKDFPDSVKHLADKNNYPIISVSDDIPYANLIQKISNLLMTEQLDMFTEVKLYSLLHEQHSVREQQDILSYLVPNCPVKFACIYVKFSKGEPRILRSLKNNIFEQIHTPFLNYQNGGFLVVDLGIYKELDVVLKALPKAFFPGPPDYSVGISNFSANVEHLAAAFQEAVDASLIGEITGTQITYYEKIPVYHLLLPLRSHHSLKAYCEYILGPLQVYEARHNVELLQTIAVYLELNGNIVQTAAQMNTHANTIRFRINKARSLLGLENEPYIFIEQLSVALKGKLLLKNSLTLGTASDNVCK